MHCGTLVCRSYSMFLDGIENQKRRSPFSLILSAIAIVLSLTIMICGLSITYMSFILAKGADLIISFSMDLVVSFRISLSMPLSTNVILALFSGDKTGEKLAAVKAFLVSSLKTVQL